MEYILLSISVLSMVLQEALLNYSSKNLLKDKKDTYLLNLIQYISAFVVFVVQAIISGGFSWYSAILGGIFGMMTLGVYVNKLAALAIGPMHITVMIATSSMILPTLSGVFFGENLSPIKIVLVTVLLCFIGFIVSGRSSQGRVNLKWLLLCIPVFFLNGGLGVMQKIHQSSLHRSETAVFLASAFLCSTVYSLFVLLRTRKTATEAAAPAVSDGTKMKKLVVLSVVSGGCIYAMNTINLYLSGVLSSQVFFPLVNGTSLIACSLLSVFMFKEKMTVRQLIGMIGGFVSLLLIACIPW